MDVELRHRQTHGSLANWHPHIQLLVTDGGFRADGTFVPWPAHDTAALTEAFRRAVLRLFVRRGLFEADDAQGMLAWPHSGFHVHDGTCMTACGCRTATWISRSGSRGTARGTPWRSSAWRTTAHHAGALSLRQARRADGGHGDRRSAGVSGPPRDAHSRTSTR
ncbi:MAG: transposase [Gemmatimonadaceae bacterium]|nr:transposase [Gemmatimonadaceae bacterium]MBA3558020.1 transposase [Gemmatimonadaceae bacterium]